MPKKARSTPTRDDHERFCIVEGWTALNRASGGAVRHHATFELALPDGRVLRTRISRPVDRTDYGPSLWAHILRDQLAVTGEEFWACVEDGVRPARGHPSPVAGALPAGLAFMLRDRVGVTETELAEMTMAEALARLNEYWSQERGV